MTSLFEDVIIRDAMDSDLTAILDIVNYSILHSTANYNYDVSTYEVQKLWFDDRKSKGFPVIVATTKDNEVLGYASFGSFREKKGYQYTIEHSVYVRHDIIKQGIGKKLLSELINRAKISGYHNMIGVIDATNNGSIQFHENFGFTVVGNIKEVGHKFDRWLDVVIMSLIL